MSFGAYSLGNIGYHVYRFRDCEDAYHELMAVINYVSTFSYQIKYNILHIFFFLGNSNSKRRFKNKRCHNRLN